MMALDEPATKRDVLLIVLVVELVPSALPTVLALAPA